MRQPKIPNASLHLSMQRKKESNNRKTLPKCDDYIKWLSNAEEYFLNYFSCSFLHVPAEEKSNEYSIGKITHCDRNHFPLDAG